MVWQNELEEFIVTFYHSEWRRSDLIRRRFVEARKILGSARRWRGGDGVLAIANFYL